ncbi:hypothetical protein L665_03532 [Ralstonia solanacearum SD54]|nr:hypothetical protein L665_03532 [Ralstonia solanacearum SD54]
MLGTLVVWHGRLRGVGHFVLGKSLAHSMPLDKSRVKYII